MTSKSHRSLHPSQRSSKQQGISRTDEERTSSKKVNGYQTPNSFQARGSASPFKKYSDHATNPSTEIREGSQNHSSQPKTPISFNQSPGDLISTSSAAQPRFPTEYAEYAAAVKNGTASLGIETPAYLQNSLVDRYGQYVCWSVEERGPGEVDLTGGFGTQVPYQEVVWYGHGNGELEGRLAGIGAQFDC